jgi:hypothetical protein
MSPRIKEKRGSGKSVLKLAQDLVAKKCGLIRDDEALDEMTLNQYMQMYKKPLTKDSMSAIFKLTEVAQEKKKTKIKDKKGKKKQKVDEDDVDKTKKSKKPKKKGALVGAST